MDKKDKNTEVFNHPNGVEVKLTAKSVNIMGIVIFIILFLTGSAAFVYIWDEFSAYNIGYYLGNYIGVGALKFLLLVTVYLIAYTVIQGTVLYWFGGKDWKAFRWVSDWKGVGLHWSHPIALKYYRVVLLLPGILLGVLPTIHGFCTGNASVFYIGLFGILAASGDTVFWHKLRPFDDEDLLLAGKQSFEATIIKRNYGKNS